MKKLFFCFTTLSLFFFISPVNLNAKSVTGNVSVGSAHSAQASSAVNKVRLDEIKSIDTSTLSRLEKRELRKEVRTINHDLKANSDSVPVEGRNGGIYLSAGGIIIILILLIILI